MLTGRFHLKYHHETRQVRQLVLGVGKNGPKFQSSRNQDEKERVNIRATEISGVNIPFGHFVTILEAQVGYPIINETGLRGNYDLALRYVRDDSTDAGGPSVYAALLDLGLKLYTRQAPADVFVIDSAERPRGD